MKMLQHECASYHRKAKVLSLFYGSLLCITIAVNNVVRRESPYMMQPPNLKRKEKIIQILSCDQAELN